MINFVVCINIELRASHCLHYILPLIARKDPDHLVLTLRGTRNTLTITSYINLSIGYIGAATTLVKNSSKPLSGIDIGYGGIHEISARDCIPVCTLYTGMG